jgi:hypothetical protein
MRLKTLSPLIHTMFLILATGLLVGCTVQLQDAGMLSPLNSPTETELLAAADDAVYYNAYSDDGRPDEGTLDALMKLNAWDGTEVNRVAMIVMAEVGDASYDFFAAYHAETGELAEVTDEMIKEGHAWPVVRFTLNVEEVLWSDGAHPDGLPVILRLDDWGRDPSQPGWTEHYEGLGFKLTQTGDRYLFMLYPDTYADPVEYALLYDENRLLVDEQGVLYYSQFLPPMPARHGPLFGDDGGEEQPVVTVDDLVKAAEAMGKE